MSYIRSGSNPEKLYIWGDDENATIAEGHKDTWNIPLNVFNGLIKKYKGNYNETPCSYKDAKVDEVLVDNDNNEVDEENYVPTQGVTKEWKIKLSYEDHFCIMWLVTWEHIVNSRTFDKT